MTQGQLDPVSRVDLVVRCVLSLQEEVLMDERVAELEARLRDLSRRIGQAKHAGRDPSGLVDQHRDLQKQLRLLQSESSVETPDADQTPLFRTQVITRVEDLDNIKDDYEALLVRSPTTSPFMSLYWLIPRFRHLCAQDYDLRFIAVYHRDGRLVGAAPLMIGVERWHLLRQEVLRFVGTSPHINNYLNSFLVDPKLAVNAMDLLTAVMWGMTHPETALVLDHISPFADGAMLRRRLLDDWHRDWMVLSGGQGYYGTLGTSFEAFVRQLPSKKARENLRRQPKRLREAFDCVECRSCDSTEDLEAFLSRLRLLSMWRQAQKGQRSSLSRDAEFASTVEGMSLMWEQGWVRTYELVCDGESAGLALGVVFGDTYFSCQRVFNPDFARFGVSHCLLAQIVDDCIAKGVRQINLVTGGESYKAEYFVPQRPCFSMVGLPTSHAARAKLLGRYALKSLWRWARR